MYKGIEYDGFVLHSYDFVILSFLSDTSESVGVRNLSNGINDAFRLNKLYVYIKFLRLNGLIVRNKQATRYVYQITAKGLSCLTYLEAVFAAEVKKHLGEAYTDLL